MFLLFTDEAQTNKALKSLSSVWTDNRYKTYYYFFLREWAGGFKRPQWEKQPYQTCDSDTEAWARHSLWSRQPRMILALLQLATAVFPWGGRTIPLVLGEAGPLHFAMGWAHNTNATGAPQPAPCGTKEVGRIRRVDPAWGEQPLRGNQRRNCKKKKKKKERKGLHCKLLKRKNRKSSLANPCAIFSCPIIRVLSSWVLEPYITPQRLKKKKKKKCLERKSKLRFRVNRASWCFRLSFAASLETTTLGQGSDGMLPYWQWFNENTLLFKHFFCFLSIVFSPNFFFSTL